MRRHKCLRLGCRRLSPERQLFCKKCWWEVLSVGERQGLTVRREKYGVHSREFQDALSLVIEGHPVYFSDGLESIARDRVYEYVRFLTGPHPCKHP